ncbi:DUF7507 domain-containing protein [Flavobacterium chryseum]|uniref:DUF7507 domain-containing protein n=1 Tax=Flavobacterium sp. P3160 TaxID=2512113 RepID=UPI001414DAD4|nr:T9SS sorting signal type C domain-containing protein [Flavobacterium sp. P3160]
MLSQNTITRIHTDWKGYWTSNSTTGVGNRPDTANNLLAFAWNGTTYSTGVNDNVLTTNAVTFNPQKFRALKIQTLGLDTSMYYLQGSMIDGSASTAKLVPALAGSTSTGAELSSRLTDGTSGLTLGTGIANIKTGISEFKIGTNNLNIPGIGDGIPDIIVTQVAEPGGQYDTFKFVNAAGATVGTEISIKFDAITAIGTYSLDLFRADNGTVAFTPAATRDIRMLGIETSSFGINATNASQVDRFVVTFSGSSDCAFIAFNTNSLKIAELGLVKKASLATCGKVGNTINYTFEVTNTGEVPITDIKITDPMPGLVISGNPIASLAAGAKATLTGTYTITAADVAAGKVVNSAKVTGTDPSLNIIEDISGQTNTDNIATTLLLPAPTFTAQPGASTCIGTSVTYSTETGMTNYVWGLQGTAGTNYTIVSGGGTGDSSVTLKYLTAGSKTVSVNYTNTNGCTVATATSSSAVTVNALPTPTFTAQPTAPICIGTTVTYTTQAGMSNYVWVFPGLAGTNYVIDNKGTNVDNTVTLHYLTAGTKIVTVNYSNSNGCTAASAISSFTTTVNPLPSAPSLVASNISCTTTGSVALSNLPSGAWTINQTGFASNTINGSGTTYTVSGLAAGTYRFTVSNGTCTSVVSSDVTITDQSSTTWNGTAWSNLPPNATKAAIIAGTFAVSSDLTACSLTINTGINIVVPSDRTLYIINGLNVSSGSTLTFENHSSLVQVNNNAVNSGTITYKRIAAQIRQADYIYWSTPVTPQKLIDVSPYTLGDKFMGFNGNNWVITNKNTIMTIGKGYIIRGPQTFSNTVKADYEASFKGVPNNGIINGETLAAGKYYLIGNPYPSALDADTFITENNFLEGTLYFWTHNTPVVLSGAYKYSSTDYASYNLTGGVGTGLQAPSSNPSNNNSKPSGYIGAGQSFFASAATGGTIAFNNGMRLGAADNTQFFKSASKTAAVEKHRVWLNMTNTEGAFKQMLVGYVQGATNEYEPRYDGVSFDANTYIDFYSVANNNNYVIQARALPFTDTDLVPLGYRTTIAGEFTISIDQADGNMKNQVIYLEDKTTGTIHNLTQSDYKFTTVKGTFADRFVLRYTNKTLGTGDFENIENGLLVSVKDKTIKVLSSKENIKEISIYDVSGKLLYNKKKVGTTELQIQNLQAANQVLLVKVTLENNFTAAKKIIFN